MKKRKLAVRGEAPVASDPAAGGDSSTTERDGSFAVIFGALKDTVTIPSRTNLTDPIDEDWNAVR